MQGCRLPFLCVLLLFLAALGTPAAWSQTPLTTPREKISYGFGANMARGMLQDGVKAEDIEVAIFLEGFRDALAEQKLRLTEQEFADAYNQAMIPLLKKRSEERLAKLKAEGEAFLASNGKKEGVKTTASGLQYRVLKQGTGKSPRATDAVRAQYKGMFLDGSVFDQSREPIEFPLNGVIPGWTEVLQLMREGDQFQVFIPAKLGYGERGALNRQTGQYDIPPHATLIFEIALVQVVPLEDIPIK